jgi:hypothetical protein
MNAWAQRFAPLPTLRLLNHGQDEEFVKHKPGVIMGYLAYGHSFLDATGAP